MFVCKRARAPHRNTTNSLLFSRDEPKTSCNEPRPASIGPLVWARAHAHQSRLEGARVGAMIAHCCMFVFAAAAAAAAAQTCAIYRRSCVSSGTSESHVLIESLRCHTSHIHTSANNRLARELLVRIHSARTKTMSNVINI